MGLPGYLPVTARGERQRGGMAEDAGKKTPGIEAFDLGKITAGLVGLRYPWWRLAAGGVVFLIAAIFAASLGSVDIPFPSVVLVFLSRLPGIDAPADTPATWDTILWQLRFPRVVLAGIVGGALAMSGAAYQGLFKNPLADPYLVGVASGAGLGATIVLLTGVPLVVWGFSFLPIAAFAGGIAAVSLAYIIARGAQGTPLTTLILAGVAIASLAGAVTSLLMLRTDPELRPVLSWLLGSFITAGLERKRRGAALSRALSCRAIGVRPDSQRAPAERRPRVDVGGRCREGEAAADSGGDPGHGCRGVFHRPHRVRGSDPRPTQCGWSGALTTVSSCPCRPSWGAFF